MNEFPSPREEEHVQGTMAAGGTFLLLCPHQKALILFYYFIAQPFSWDLDVPTVSVMEIRLLGTDKK